MIFLYVDEAGDPYSHHSPILDGETPLFCLSGVAVRATQWRILGRSLQGLKRTYYSTEIQAFLAEDPTGKRSEHHYEVKGRWLVKPSNRNSRRCRGFARGTLQICRELDAKIFSIVWCKSSVAPTDPMSIYTSCLQYLTERFHYYCLAQGDQGLIVVDGRANNLDFQVSASHTSFLLGNPIGKTYTTITEAPMFVDSRLSAGVQLADAIGALIYGSHYHRECRDVPGYFVGTRPVTAAEFGTANGRPNIDWELRPLARDYSHCLEYRPAIDGLQFRRTDVPPPSAGGPIVPAYFGIRVIRASGQ